jgi:ABC-type glycerol-3-phosphate transport system substrate-binding protein
MFIARLACLLCFTFASFGTAQVAIEFWHSYNTTEETLHSLIEDFHRSQSAYRVVPRYAGNLQKAAIKLAAALASGNPPVLFEAEVTVFPRLVKEGAVLDLSDLMATLPQEIRQDWPIQG